MDVPRLLEAVEPDSPCGPDLAFDEEFRKMEKAAQGSPERQMGDSVIEEVPADWRTVEEAALGLLGRTKDLRVVLYLTQANVRVNGFPGLSSSLELLAGLIGQFWPTIHPELDPDFDMDPTQRVNILTSFAAKATMLAPIRRDAILVRFAGKGYSLQDVLVAEGKAPAPEGEDAVVADRASVDAAFARCDLAELEAATTGVAGALEHLAAVNAALGEVLGPMQAPELEPLEKLLGEIHALLQARLAERGGSGEQAGAEDGAEGEAAASGGPTALPGRISNRDQAMRVLDLASEYFERNEPSSPVPLLLKRAQRLISKDFMEILKDIAPDGMDQAEKIRGPEAEPE